MQVIVLSSATNRASHRHAVIIAMAALLLPTLFCLPPSQAAAPPKSTVKNPTDKNGPPKPTPELHIPLDPLGYKPQLLGHLFTGDSVRSLDFVDPNHLLLTYSLHDLIHRQPECSASFDEQTIQAVLIELPSGRVVARRNWSMCDTARYIWPLGHGRFLLRQGSQLSVVAPLENLSTDDPLAPRNILHFGGAMMAINLSPDSRYLVVQYKIPAPAPSLEKLPGISTDGLGLTDIESHHVSVNIFVLNPDAPRADGIYAQRFGDLKSVNVLWIPMIENGFLESTDAGNGKRWAMDLVGFTNGKSSLVGIDSTCQPIANFLSNREYATIVCPPGSDQKALAVYSLDIGLLWMEHFEQPFAQDNIVIAPDAGRFAMSVVSTLYKTSHFEPVNGDNSSGQWVRVYDTLTGAIRLTVEARPIQMDGRNYTLAPDGSRLAVLGSDAIDVYALPPLAVEKIIPVTTNAVAR
jgi:hypothetical protein